MVDLEVFSDVFCPAKTGPRRMDGSAANRRAMSVLVTPIREAVRAVSKDGPHDFFVVLPSDPARHGVR